MTPEQSVPIATTTKWETVNLWSPQDVADFLSTLKPEQSSMAKVLKYEVKIMVLYPSA